MELPFFAYLPEAARRLMEAQAVVIIDRDSEDGKILAASRPFELMFGYTTAGSLLDKSIDTLLPDGLRKAHAAHRVEFLKRPKTRPMGLLKELRGQKQDGATFKVYVEIGAFDIPPFRCAWAVVSDMSESQESEYKNAVESELRR